MVGLPFRCKSPGIGYQEPLFAHARISLVSAPSKHVCVKDVCVELWLQRCCSLVFEKAGAGTLRPSG